MHVRLFNGLELGASHQDEARQGRSTICCDEKVTPHAAHPGGALVSKHMLEINMYLFTVDLSGTST
jgi:hypothetical protein